MYSFPVTLDQFKYKVYSYGSCTHALQAYESHANIKVLVNQSYNFPDRQYPSLHPRKGAIVLQLLDMASRRLLLEEIMLSRWRTQVEGLGTCLVEASISLYSFPQISSSSYIRYPPMRQRDIQRTNIVMLLHWGTNQGDQKAMMCKKVYKLKEAL